MRRGFLIALAALVVAAGGFWTWWLTDQPRLSNAAAGAAREVILKCTECKVQTQMPGDKVATLERDEAGTIKCRACGKFAVQSPYRKGGQMLPAGAAAPPSGGG